MKSFFHKIMSCSMALLLLVSTTSWKIEKHYCMGHLVDTAIFSEADSCGMDIAVLEDGAELEDKMSCCDEEIVVLDGQDDLKLSFNDIDFDKQLFLAAYVYSYINLFEGFGEQLTPFSQYPPPVLVKDIQLLDQVFLI